MQEKIDRMKSALNNMPEQKEYDVDIPKIDAEELKKALKLADSYTMETIMQYIQVDTYELVKKIAKTINSTNFWDVAIYIDGALSRNDALVKLLGECIKWKTYIDRINGETSVKRK